MIRALPAPGASVRPSSRLKALIGLAGIVAAGIALWPRESTPTDVVATSSAPPLSARAAASTTGSQIGTGSAPRVIKAAAVDLFAGHSWYLPPPPPPARDPEPPPPPTAPPFPYSYMGQYERPGDKAVYFLQRGDSVFDVQVGQVLDGVWNIDAVADGRMRLTYTPLKLQQVISLGSSP